MRYLYSFLIQFYGLLIFCASFVNSKAKKWCDGRKNWLNSLKKNRNLQLKYIWIHCASAGEYEQAIPLIQQIRKEQKEDYQIAVSFFSPSGFGSYQSSKEIDLLFYLPLDTPKNAIQLLEILQPKFAFFIRYEIWWNILFELKNKNIPTYLINANPHQKRNFIYKKYLAQTLPFFTEVFHTNKVGSTKIERVLNIKDADNFSDSYLENFSKDSYVILLGSSWETEEKYVAAFYKKYISKIKNLKIIIAPHEYNSTKIQVLSSLFNCNIHCYSVEKNKPPFTTERIASILFLDQKGILKHVYKYADIALIGGGFKNGIHNCSEAMVYKIPVLFGPNYKQFEDAIEYMSSKVAFSFQNYDEFEHILLDLYQQPINLHQLEALDFYFSKNKNTSQEILNTINLK
jgi:3-deoxy-D-manno-octulosonic-acid transferase